MSTPRIVMISGPLDLSPEEFEIHYKPHLDRAIANHEHFIVGSAQGADTMARDYLLNHTQPERIFVYYFSDNPKFIQLHQLRAAADRPILLLGYATAEARDEAMTLASHYDIAYVRSKEEMIQRLGTKYDPNYLTGTQKNILRRIKKNQSS